MHFLFLFTGSVVNGSVNQSPSNLIKSERDTAELVCEHNIPSYTMIFWYKQTLSRDLTLLGYTWNKNSIPEDNFNKKIKLDGDGTKNGSLKILQLEASDSAMYYCAASFHSVMSSHATIQKALKAAVLHN
uniref:Ig-like domain-containing protein n=1 Tax=Sinocyclocheilus rhinocerous TaxID=307959 RepID=A0A673LZA0_9TELE